MNNIFGKEYAFFYDIFYQNKKDYKKETRCLVSVLNSYSPKKPRTILDIACGTGSHANIFAEMGYNVTGVDASSHMLNRARLKAKQRSLDVTYLKARMENLNLGKKYDAIISMFTIVDYLTEADKLVKFFNRVRTHMKKSSLYIFDFWNRAAVLKDYKPYNIRKFTYKNFIITRESHSTVHPDDNLIKINYTVKIFNILKKNRLEKMFSESHALRFYSVPEIALFLYNCGLQVVKMFPFINPRKKLKPYDCDIVVIAKRMR